MNWVNCYSTRRTTDVSICFRIVREAILNLQIIAIAGAACLDIDAVADIELNTVSLGRCDVPAARLIIWIFPWIIRAANNTWCPRKKGVCRTYWKNKTNPSYYKIAFLSTCDGVTRPFNRDLKQTTTPSCYGNTSIAQQKRRFPFDQNFRCNFLEISRRAKGTDIFSVEKDKPQCSVRL